MRFRSYDSLRLFDVVARHQSFTSAANELSLTKGAVSYQIKSLESELGFRVFARGHRKVSLTEKGKELWRVSRVVFKDLETQIARLREEDVEPITIGMSTYFASRWLSPRLMNFICEHPRVALRLQPLVDLFDIGNQGIDIAIRWGTGQWSDMKTEALLACPAFPTAGASLARHIEAAGLAQALGDLTLLHDREGSDAWRDWHQAAGLGYRPARDTLVIPDPNVRVQAVINGQGVALNDALVAKELTSGQLRKVSSVELRDYGYFLVYADGALENPNLRAFRDWIIVEAKTGPRDSADQGNAAPLGRAQ
jgi:DNA-binding transcriptional LysR family regulator